MQIHLHEVKTLQFHNARPEFVKKNHHGYKPIRIQHSYIRCNYVLNWRHRPPQHQIIFVVLNISCNV
jgi:hypothetical protein